MRACASGVPIVLDRSDGLRGSQYFMCLYDLQIDFNSVEYPVLLERLYEVGVNGKTWRLLRSWYEGAFCKFNGMASRVREFHGGKSGKTGLHSVTFAIPPCETSGLGLSVNNFYAGGFLHADDIRTLTTRANSLSALVSLVKSFAEENFLKLNV